MRDRGRPVGGDDDALARRQAVVLDHERRRRTRRAPRRDLRRRCAPTRGRAVGTPAAAMTCLAKDLLPSSWAASRRRAEAGDARAADGVGGAGHQRRLRARRRRGRPATRGRAPRPRRDLPRRPGGLGDRARAGVAGGARERGDRGVGPQSEAEGVFPGAGADHEDAHGCRTYRRSPGAPVLRQSAVLRLRSDARCHRGCSWRRAGDHPGERPRVRDGSPAGRSCAAHRVRR